MACNDKLVLVNIEPDGLVRAAIVGRLSGPDVRTASGVNPFETLLGSNWAGSRVLLDMSRNDHVDSEAIGWLINSQAALKQRRGVLVLHSLSPLVRGMLSMLKLDQLLCIQSDEAAARDFLRNRAGPGGATPGEQAPGTEDGR